MALGINAKSVITLAELITDTNSWFISTAVHLSCLLLNDPTMSTTTSSKYVSGFRPFTLAMVQLGSIGQDKGQNIKHAREMLVKASKGTSEYSSVDLLMLPVRRMPF
jgi:hypothetical protein